MVKIRKTGLIGDLPSIEIGPNIGRLDRKQTAIIYSFSEKEVHKAYNNWQMLFYRQPETSLTFKEYLDKMIEASISPDKLGNALDSYHLSRYNDEGPYTKDSCRFIKKIDNIKEQISNGKSAVTGSLA